MAVEKKLAAGGAFTFTLDGQSLVYPPISTLTISMLTIPAPLVSTHIVSTLTISTLRMRPSERSLT